MHVPTLSERRTGIPTAMKGVLAMMAVQVFIAIRMFTTPDAMTDRALGWNLLLLNRQTLFGSVLLGALMWLAMVKPRLAHHRDAWVSAATPSRGALPLLLQIGACLACYALAWPLYFRTAVIGALGWPLMLAWCVAVAACTIASLWLLAPARFWRTLLAQERPAFVVSGIGVIGSAALILLIHRAWTAVPQLAAFTLNSSARLLRPFYPQMKVDTVSAIIEIDAFSVLISDACSGYFGVSLTLGFLACYCYVFRAEIRPWLMAALLPVGVVMSLSLNAVRIAALVTLGVEFSPEVAAKGFHTNAGSIAMVLSCMLIVALVHRFVVAPADAAEDAAPRVGWTLDFESALLIPLMALLGITLLTGAFSGSFVWLYPLRVIVVAVTLRLCWKHLRHLVDGAAWLPYAVGAAVYALWIVMIDADREASSAFSAALAGVSPAVAGGWLLMRTIGAVVTVPIAEELAFRGYLIAVLSRRPVLAGVRLPFDWIGYAGSSLLFGALHGQWLAGTMAGLAYGWLRYRRDRIWDAVVAHMITNLLLAIHVMTTGQWSYW